MPMPIWMYMYMHNGGVAGLAIPRTRTLYIPYLSVIQEILVGLHCLHISMMAILHL